MAQNNPWDNDPIFTAPTSGGPVMLPAAPDKPPAPPSRTAPGAATEGLKPGFMWVDPNNPAAGQVKIPTAPNPQAPQTRERQAQIKTILGTIQRIRGLADESMAVGSTAEFFQNTPMLNQNVRNVQAAVEQLRGDIIQQQLAQLAEANQGGVASLANSVSEAERMAASIAPLNPAQSLPEFLQGLDNAEDYYLRQAATVEGKTAPDDDIIQQYLPEERRKELSSRKPDQMGLATDGTKSVPVPQWYQDSVNRYLAENGRNLDASQYAAFRMGLDEQAGLKGRNLQSYVQEGQQLREGVAAGAQISPLPATMQVPASAMETAFNQFAASPLGAGTLSAVNSATAGIIPALSGQGEAMEAVRQNQPVASFVGDVGGGIAGTVALGGGLAQLGARGLLANPMAQNAAFSAVSGATQSEDPLQGAAMGVVGSLGGDLAGRAIGRALPDVFARGSMREAVETVPSGGDLANQADRLYRAAAANGQQIAPAQTDQFIGNTENFLRQSGYMTPQGDLLGSGPVQDATRLLQSFRGQPIGPMEAQTIRKKIAEGRTAMRDGAPDNEARMFSGDLTNQFDQFAEAQNALPGIAAAREVAQRRIMGREIDRATELGDARGAINYSQGGGDLGIRRAFGALDTAEVRGSKMYPPEVSQAIERVSRGTPVRNLAQLIGRAAPVTGVGASAPLGLGTLAGLGTMDPVTGLMTAGTVAGAGLFGRALANRMTRRDAEMASLVARGGPAFQNLLQQAQDEAAITGGRFGAGLFGAAAPMPLRDQRM